MPECFLYESVVFFAVWDSKMAAVTKNSAEHENDQYLNNRLMDFDQIFVRMMLA